MKKPFIIILVLAVLALGGYWWFSTQKNEATAPVAEETQENSEEGVVNSVSVEAEAAGSASAGQEQSGQGGTPGSTEKVE